MATELIERLTKSHPGWDIWSELLDLVQSLEFESVQDAHLGDFYSAGARLSFGVVPDDWALPNWMPAYVEALYNMKAANWEMAGGFAGTFSGESAETGFLFSAAGNDEELGYPVIDVPSGIFDFQSNSGGALFFVNQQLEILYPNSDGECFEVLDSVEEFTRTCIRNAIDDKDWFSAYEDNIKGDLIE